MKDLGPLHHFFGVKVAQNQHTDMDWSAYLYRKIVRKFGMEDSRPVNTPVNPDLKLTQGVKED